MRVTERDIELPGGGALHLYDTLGDGEDDGRASSSVPVVWFHGTPNIGSPPAPLFEAARLLAMRWVSYDRPGYGGSTPRPGRDVASAAGDVVAVADALGIDRFAVMSHSGGGPHALACAALLPERVMGGVIVSGLAPYDAPGLDWFAGMGPGSAASLRAAAAGRAAKGRHESASSDVEPDFIPADYEALAGVWSWFGSVVGPAMAAGPGPLIDDDLAYVSPWGFDPARTTAPLLFLHGGSDRMVPSSHAEWLARRCPSAELRISPDDGHISVLRHADAAMGWLRENVGSTAGLRGASPS